MRWSRLRLPLCAVGLLSALVACTSTDPVQPMSDDPMTVGGLPGLGAGMGHGRVVDEPYAMPDMTLEDTSGKPFNLVTDTTDPVTLMFFGYTSCPNICPLVMSDIAVAMTKLTPQVRAMTQVVFITTDPARDTPS